MEISTITEEASMVRLDVGGGVLMEDRSFGSTRMGRRMLDAAQEEGPDAGSLTAPQHLGFPTAPADASEDDEGMPAVHRVPSNHSARSSALSAASGDTESVMSGSVASDSELRRESGAFAQYRRRRRTVSARGRRRLEDTSEEAIRMALLRVLLSCYLGPGASESVGACGLPSGARCPLHRRIDMLREGLRHLEGFACVPTFRVKLRSQCKKCGFLVQPNASSNAGSLRCFACETEIRPPVAKHTAIHSL